MTKKLFSIICLNILFSLAWGVTLFNSSITQTKGSGFLRVEPAMGTPQGRFTIGFALRGFNYHPSGVSHSYSGGNLTLGIDYGIIQNLSGRLWLPYYLDIGKDRKENGLGDIGIGLRYTVRDFLSVEPLIIVPSGRGIFGPDEGEGVFRYFTTGRIDPGLGISFSHRMDDFRFTASGTYLYHGSGNQYIAGLGVCYEKDNVRPFLEFVAEDRGGFNEDDPTSFGPDIAYITPGLAYKAMPDLILSLGLDIRVRWEELFGGSYPQDWRNEHHITAGPGGIQPWAINLSLKYTLGRVTYKKTIIAGEVIDAETGKSILAEISFPDSKIGPVKTDQSGRFKISAKGEAIRLTISAHGYGSLTREIILRPGNTMNFLFSLTSETVSLTLKVMDMETGKPIKASIFIDRGETIITTATTDTDGRCKLMLHPGEYLLKAVSRGYIPATREVLLDRGKITGINFFLTPAIRVPEGGYTLQELKSLEIRFESGQVELNEASRSYLDRAILTLKENPTLKLEIKIENEYDELFQKRLEKVRSYLIERGISADRIHP